jgi:deoxycytidylate deaminase
MTMSDDPNTTNGACLVTADGNIVIDANRLPEGINVDLSTVSRETKLQLIEHAERRVLQAAGRQGYATQGATLYCPWFACCPCARSIIGHGVKTVFGHRQALDRTPERWREEIKEADKMLDAAGVERLYYDGRLSEIDNPLLVKFNGEFWTP